MNNEGLVYYTNIGLCTKYKGHNYITILHVPTAAIHHKAVSSLIKGGTHNHSGQAMNKGSSLYNNRPSLPLTFIGAVG